MKKGTDDLPANRRRLLLAALALCVLAVLPYIRSLDSGFCWDDYTTFLSGRDVKGDVVRTGFRTLGGAWHSSRFRRLPFLTYGIDYRLGGAYGRAHPLPFRLTGIALHVALVLLAWSAWLGISRRLGADGFVPASLGAAVLAVHPLASESVLYAAARPGTMLAVCTVGTLACLYGGLNRSGGKRWALLAGAAACLALGTLCKETGFFVPPAVAAAALAVTERRRLRGARYAALLLVPLALLWILHPARNDLRAGIARRFAPRTVTDDHFGLGQDFEFNAPNFVATQTRTFWRAASLAVFPFLRQNVDHRVRWNDGPWNPPWTVPAALGLLLVPAALVFAYLRREDGGGLPAVAALIVVLGYLPYLVVPGLQPLVEHRLLIPLAGLTLLAGCAFGALDVRRRPVAAAAAAVVLALGAAAFVRTGAWENEVTLWRDAVEKNGDRVRSKVELAVALARDRFRNPASLDEAVRLLEGVVRHHPDNILALGDLAAILTLTNRERDAIPHLERMRDLGTVRPRHVFLLAWLYGKYGRRDDALRTLDAVEPRLPSSLRSRARDLRSRLNSPTYPRSPSR